MPANPLAAKFAKWSSDEEDEPDAFSMGMDRMGMGSPFARGLNITAEVSVAA
jgi:hypothetical protein